MRHEQKRQRARAELHLQEVLHRTASTPANNQEKSFLLRRHFPFAGAPKLHTGNRSKQVPTGQSLEQTWLDRPQRSEPSPDQPDPYWSAATWAGNKHYESMPLKFCVCLLYSDNWLLNHMFFYPYFHTILHTHTHTKQRKQHQDTFLTRMEYLTEKHNNSINITY